MTDATMRSPPGEARRGLDGGGPLEGGVGLGIGARGGRPPGRADGGGVGRVRVAGYDAGAAGFAWMNPENGRVAAGRGPARLLRASRGPLPTLSPRERAFLSCSMHDVHIIRKYFIDWLDIHSGRAQIGRQDAASGGCALRVGAGAKKTPSKPRGDVRPAFASRAQAQSGARTAPAQTPARARRRYARNRVPPLGRADGGERRTKWNKGWTCSTSGEAGLERRLHAGRSSRI